MTATAEVIDMLARAVGYMSRVETRGRADRDWLALAQWQVRAALTALQAPPLDLVPRGTCEPCGEPTDTPPECRDCLERADAEAAQAWREGRYE